MRKLSLAVSALALTTASTAFADEYRIDGFEDGGVAGFQAGFVSGEMAATCFTEPEDRYPVRITAVRFLFGDNSGSTEARYLTIKIFGEGGSGTQPGALIREITDVEVNASITAFSELDLTAENISVNGPWCVGIQFGHDGPPSVARDDDGNVSSGDNWIWANAGGPFTWFRSSDLLVPGDWIIRTIGTPRSGGGGGDTGNPDTGTPDTGSPDAGPEDTGTPDAGPEDTGTPDTETPDAGTPDTAAAEVRVVSISPTTAFTNEAVDVQIAGAGFEDGFQFKIGPARLSNVAVLDDAVVTATLEADSLAAGTYDIIVLDGGVEVAFQRSAFQVREPEEVTTQPGSGCATAGGGLGWAHLVALGLVAVRRRRVRA